MVGRTRLSIAKNDIAAHFDGLTNNILKHKELAGILKNNRETWRLAQSLTVAKFATYLQNNANLKKVVLELPHRRETRYLWGNVSPYELALSLRVHSYLTHYTAMYLHELTEQIPKTIYVNSEQSAKRFKDKDLKQERIDLAFKRRARVTTNTAKFGSLQITMINGMHTKELGVVTTTASDGAEIRVTNIERTLIDITVRPEYSGGFDQILGAFGRAKNRVSTNRLAAFLKQLNYVYPYHQPIGFYLEKAGYDHSALALFEEMGKQFDFYLGYGITDREYSEKWRIYYPRGL